MNKSNIDLEIERKQNIVKRLSDYLKGDLHRTASGDEIAKRDISLQESDIKYLQTLKGTDKEIFN